MADQQAIFLLPSAAALAATLALNQYTRLLCISLVRLAALDLQAVNDYGPGMEAQAIKLTLTVFCER